MKTLLLPVHAAVPKEAVLPEVGSVPRVVFPTDTLGKLVKEFEANKFEDTMAINVSNNQMSFRVEGDSGKCEVKLSHDDESSKPELHLLLSHLEDSDAERELLLSLKLLSQIVKVGVPLAPYWELLLKQNRPYVFRLPLYRTWKDDGWEADEDGRSGSGLKFFQNGFKKNVRCNNNFAHMHDRQMGPDGILLAAAANRDEFDEDDNVQKRAAIRREVANKIDPQKDASIESPIENDDTWGIRDGLLTFYLPPKQAVNSKTVSFKSMESTPLAKKRRELAEKREDDVNEVKRLPTHDNKDENPKGSKRAKIDLPLN